MKPFLALLAVGVVVAGQAHGQGSYPKAQIDQLERLNDKCRGGSGDDPNTQKACDQRDAVYSKLEKSGWCYGGPGDAGYQRSWKRCPVSAPPEEVVDEAYVYPFAGMAVGATVNNQFPTILYLHKKCELPLVHAKDMRAYASYRGVWDIGCWGKDIDGNAIIVVPQMGTQSMSLSVLPLADVQANRTTMTIKALPTYGR